jgi:hydrogenase-4 component F
VLLLAGLFAITGSPPFGLFVSEFAIVSGAIRGDHAWIASIMLGLLAIIFAGIGAMFIGAVFGEPRVPDDDSARPHAESSWLVIGPLVLTAVVLMLGIYIPAPFRSSIGAAARLLGGTVP